VEGGFFQSKAFASFAKDKILFVSIESQVPGRVNDKLLEQHRYSGFPSFGLMNEDGEILASFPVGWRNVKDDKLDEGVSKTYEKAVDLHKRVLAVKAKSEKDAKIEKQNQIYNLVRTSRQPGVQEGMAVIFYKLYKEGVRPEPVLERTNWVFYCLVAKQALDNNDLKTAEACIKIAEDHIPTSQLGAYVENLRDKFDMLSEDEEEDEEEEEGSN